MRLVTATAIIATLTIAPQALAHPPTGDDTPPANRANTCAGGDTAPLICWTPRAIPKRTHQDAVTSNLILIARCETGGKPGQHGRPDWKHRARSEHRGLDYEGALGFLETTWDVFKPKGYPAGAHQATRAQQLVVGRRLVARYGGYSSWPSCSRRLGLR